MGKCIPVLLLVLTGCAGTAQREVTSAPGSYNIDQQMLSEERGAGAAGAIEPYRLAPTETFRMPEPVQAAQPQLPAGYEHRELPPTTLCVRVIVDADGGVQRSEALLAHSHCAAGTLAQHAALLEAALVATSGWSYRPAAVCRFAAGTRAKAPGDCTGAASVEAVPVTLAYAFTFEVEQGRARVSTQGGLR